jgi:glutamate N-acetyltransferase/amino-acid N-acetyltransferase
MEDKKTVSDNNGYKIINGAVTAPKGFAAAGVRCGIKQKGPDLAVIYSKYDCSAAAVFTTNAFKAASVIKNQEKLKSGRGRAVVVNSGNASACTGEQGLKDVDHICHFAGELLNISPEDVYNASTGIIGVPIPIFEIEVGIMDAVAEISEDGGDAAAEAIITTDTVTKKVALEIDINGTPVRIGGMCKGAGMICPAMATMLCVVTTDAAITPVDMRQLLKAAVEGSFNRVTVDGEMSTNDSVLFLSSGASGVEPGAEGLRRLGAALDALLLRIALMMVADGEGATKIMRVSVTGAEDEAQANKVARAVAGSPLVKTCMHGGDPNWGRITCAAGYSGANVVESKLDITIAGFPTLLQGKVLPFDAKAASGALKEPQVTILVNLNLGEGSATAWGCDLTEEYVVINSKYTT